MCPDRLMSKLQVGPILCMEIDSEWHIFRVILAPAKDLLSCEILPFGQDDGGCIGTCSLRNAPPIVDVITHVILSEAKDLDRLQIGFRIEMTRSFADAQDDVDINVGFW